VHRAVIFFYGLAIPVLSSTPVIQRVSCEALSSTGQCTSRPRTEVSACFGTPMTQIAAWSAEFRSEGNTVWTRVAKPDYVTVAVPTVASHRVYTAALTPLKSRAALRNTVWRVEGK